MFSGVSTPASSRKRSSLKPPGSLSTPGQQSQSTPAPPLFHTVTTAKTTVSSSSGAAQKHQLQQTPLALKRLQGTPATIQSLSRSSSGLLLSTAPSSSQQQQQQSFARVLLRTDTCSAAQLVQAEQSTLLLLLAQERGISQKQLRVTLDARSGYALATTSTTTNSSCFVWQYQKRPSTGLHSALEEFTLQRINDNNSNIDHDGGAFLRERSSSSSNNGVLLSPQIVPSPTSDDPRQSGLLLANSRGSLCYWDNISYGPAEIPQCATIELGANESGRILQFCESIGFIYATSRGSLYKLTLFDENRMPCLLYQQLHLPVTSVFARVTSILASGMDLVSSPGGSSSSGGVGVGGGNRRDDDVVAIASGFQPEGIYSREVFVLGSEHLDKWILSKTNREKHMYQIEIKSLIAEYISESRSPVIPIRNLKVDLLDMDYSKENKLVLLVSYSVRTSEWKFFMLFTLSMPGSPAGVNGIGGGGGLQIADCRPLSYRTTVGGGGVGSGTPPSSQYQSSSLPWSHGGGLARLALSNGGPTAFVFFPDAIVITSHISDIGFEDTLPIADALTDRVIGFGCVSSSSSTSSIHSAFEVDGIASAAVCCWSSGIIGLDVNVKAFIGKSQRQHVSDKERVDEQLYIKLEQAVLFASDRSLPNPLAFDLTHGDLDVAAMSLSNSFLAMDARHLPAITDLKAQLLEKFKHCDQIVRVISQAGYIDRLSTEVRYRMCFNSEKLMAGLHLWQYYNTLLDSEEGPDGFKPLIDAAERYMLHVINSTPSSSSTSSQGGLPKQALEPDFMRTFFRNHADNIGLVLGLMECKLTTNSVRRSDATRNNAITYHVNKILLIALIASLQYRNETMRLYFGGEGNDGVDDSTTTRAFRPPVEPWTCSKKMLDLLTRQLENTRACLNTTGAGSKPLTAEHYQNDQQLEGELKVQMSQMTDMLLGAYTDRVMHLQEANSEGVEQLREQQRVLHTWVIKPLVDIGKMEDAYFIAEKYRIYQSLVDMTLVTKNTGGHIEDADAKASRLGLYLDRFGQEFADVLFSTLVKENKYRELLDEKIRISNNEYDSLLDSYLKRFNMPWLSWIQDVKMRRYSGASANLNLVCKNEDDIDKKLTAVSLNKLAYLATLSSAADLTNSSVMAKLEDFNKVIDMINLQSAIHDHFLSIIKAAGSNNGSSSSIIRPDLNSLAGRVQLVTKKCYHYLDKKPGFKLIVNKCVEMVLKQRALSLADMVELLTFCGPGDRVDWFDNALALLIRLRAELSVEKFNTCLATIWRRAWLNTDWPRVWNLAKTSSDQDTRRRLMETGVFLLLQRSSQAVDVPVLEPAKCLFDEADEAMGSPTAGVAPQSQALILADYRAENTVLVESIARNRLQEVFQEILRLIV